MREKKQLVLNISELSEKADNFYRQMDDSLTFRETFLRDPVGILSKDILGGTSEKEPIQLSKTNRLLYALLSNKKFMEWAEGFEKNVQSKISATLTSNDPKEIEMELAAHLNRTYYYREIVQAMFSTLDVETFEALLNLNRESASSLLTDKDVRFKVSYDGPDKISISRDSSIGPLAQESVSDWVVVCVAIAVYAVGVLAVFAAATAAIAVAIVEVPRPLSRTDLQRISGFMTKEFTQRAELIRQEDELRINLPKRNVIFDKKNDQS
jgi:hypothetical protein